MLTGLSILEVWNATAALLSPPPGKIVLEEHTSRALTAHFWSPKKKPTLLTIVAFCQISMNFNAAVYSNALDMTAFLIPYAASLSLTNINILICALANDFVMMTGGRILGGLLSAGSSVAMGMLILVVATQVLHLVIAKESRATVLLDRAAKKQRKMGRSKVWGPNEGKRWKERFNLREIATAMLWPFQMLITEPIVFFLSLLSGFADALIFSYGYMFEKWKFTPMNILLVLVALAVSYAIRYFTFFPVAPLLYHVFLLLIGLFICAFVATGPPLQWAGIVVASVLVGIANFAI
ncbi:hypothetical protein EJ02DRAFT_502493 [Clathrospora elynae]|uniref:MFS general substrate transporter n=1 Tax=Clathrospora elynae TaxID=706981 RepID=A0A6A5ST76_9PLEO|nr:hypothetical protein EJ02DRAFT_502493 [Clathrospora elynae]